MFKLSEIPENARIWGELWIDANNNVNFKFHTQLDFLRSKFGLRRFVSIIRSRIEGAKKCPFHEHELTTTAADSEFSIFKGLVKNDWEFRGVDNKLGITFQHSCGHVIRYGPGAKMSMLSKDIRSHECDEVQ